MIAAGDIEEGGWYWAVKITKDDDGWYVVTVPALPGCISQGKTEEEALENIKEAIELHVSMLAEDILKGSFDSSKP